VLLCEHSGYAWALVLCHSQLFPVVPLYLCFYRAGGTGYA
jgi:hypothetical protein